MVVVVVVVVVVVMVLLEVVDTSLSMVPSLDKERVDSTTVDEATEEVTAVSDDSTISAGVIASLAMLSRRSPRIATCNPNESTTAATSDESDESSSPRGESSVILVSSCLETRGNVAGDRGLDLDGSLSLSITAIRLISFETFNFFCLSLGEEEDLSGSE